MRLLPVLAALAVLTACGSATDTTTSATQQAAPGCPNDPAALTCATPTPVPTMASVIPWADCSKAHFGPALEPLDPPSDVHVYSAAPAMTIDQSKFYRLTISTTRGRIVVCLQPHLAPQTVNVIVTLARNHYYDGMPFHRVVAGFVIQGGDPNCIGNTSGANCGKGGPGVQFPDEPVHQSYVLGAMAMANSGPNTNGSQFFIDIADLSTQLTPTYNIFGKVYQGQSVADSIKQGDLMNTVTVSEQI